MQEETDNNNDIDTYSAVPPRFSKYLTPELWQKFTIEERISSILMFDDPPIFFLNNCSFAQSSSKADLDDNESELFWQRIQRFNSLIGIDAMFSDDEYWGYFAIPFKNRTGSFLKNYFQYCSENNLIPISLRKPTIQQARAGILFKLTRDLFEQEADKAIISLIQERAKEYQELPDDQTENSQEKVQQSETHHMYYTPQKSNIDFNNFSVEKVSSPKFFTPKVTAKFDSHVQFSHSNSEESKTQSPFPSQPNFNSQTLIFDKQNFNQNYSRPYQLVKVKKEKEVIFVDDYSDDTQENDQPLPPHNSVNQPQKPIENQLNNESYILKTPGREQFHSFNPIQQSSYNNEGNTPYLENSKSDGFGFNHKESENGPLLDELNRNNSIENKSNQVINQIPQQSPNRFQQMNQMQQMNITEQRVQLPNRISQSQQINSKENNNPPSQIYSAQETNWYEQYKQALQINSPHKVNQSPQVTLPEQIHLLQPINSIEIRTESTQINSTQETNWYEKNNQTSQINSPQKVSQSPQVSLPEQIHLLQPINSIEIRTESTQINSTPQSNQFQPMNSLEQIKQSTQINSPEKVNQPSQIYLAEQINQSQSINSIENNNQSPQVNSTPKLSQFRQIYSMPPINSPGKVTQQNLDNLNQSDRISPNASQLMNQTTQLGQPNQIELNQSYQVTNSIEHENEEQSITNEIDHSTNKVEATEPSNSLESIMECTPNSNTTSESNQQSMHSESNSPSLYKENTQIIEESNPNPELVRDDLKNESHPCGNDSSSSDDTSSEIPSYSTSPNESYSPYRSSNSDDGTPQNKNSAELFNTTPQNNRIIYNENQDTQNNQPNENLQNDQNTNNIQNNEIRKEGNGNIASEESGFLTGFESDSEPKTNPPMVAPTDYQIAIKFKDFKSNFVNPAYLKDKDTRQFAIQSNQLLLTEEDFKYLKNGIQQIPESETTSIELAPAFLPSFKEISKYVSQESRQACATIIREHKNKFDQVEKAPQPQMAIHRFSSIDVEQLRLKPELDIVNYTETNEVNSTGSVETRILGSLDYYYYERNENYDRNDPVLYFPSPNVKVSFPFQQSQTPTS